MTNEWVLFFLFLFSFRTWNGNYLSSDSIQSFWFCWLIFIGFWRTHFLFLRKYGLKSVHSFIEISILHLLFVQYLAGTNSWHASSNGRWRSTSGQSKRQQHGYHHAVVHGGDLCLFRLHYHESMWSSCWPHEPWIDLRFSLFLAGVEEDRFNDLSGTNELWSNI